jgi:hypothetical protein
MYTVLSLREEARVAEAGWGHSTAALFLPSTSFWDFTFSLVLGHGKPDNSISF